MVDVDNILVQKKFGGGITDSELIEGVVIDKEKVHPRMPNEVKNSKIALIDSGLEIKKTEIDAKVQITDLSFSNESIGSIPAFSARVLGTISRALANVSMASCSLPPTVGAYFLS